MKKWKSKVREYNAKGYKYLGLRAIGIDVFSEWLTPEGKIVRIYYKQEVSNVH